VIRGRAAAVVALAALLALPGLAGCGGDDAPDRAGSASSTTAAGSASAEPSSIGAATDTPGGVLPPSIDPSTFSPEKKAFVDAAEAICDDSSARIAAASTAAGLTTSSAPDQITAFIRDRYVPIYRERLDALGALTLPPEDGERMKHLLADSRDSLDKLAADPTAFLEEDPFDGVDVGFDTYGLTACGSREPGG
jgi:hypothetical protein